MKKAIACILSAWIAFSLSGCDSITVTSAESSSKAPLYSASFTETAPSLPDPTPEPQFTVVFDENEVFPDDIARRAAEHIDPYIAMAVDLLNTLEPESEYNVLSCNYDERPKKRDELDDPLEVEIYDTILESVYNFGDYFYDETNYGPGFFSTFVAAQDALRVDHPELFMYSEAMFEGTTYKPGYYMPGDWLDNQCEDREQVKNEVLYFRAIVDRIIEKMPEGMDNYKKCWYFSFVICLLNEYDHSYQSMESVYQAYDTLVNGSSVCEGYSRAFYHLCREAGISCWFCIGNINERHSWNRVETDEGWRFIDLTNYDAPGLNNGTDYRSGEQGYMFMPQKELDELGYKLDYMQ